MPGAVSNSTTTPAMKLARDLAHELRAVVPDPFSVNDNRGSVVITEGSSTATTPVGDLLDQDGSGPTADEVETAAEAVLSAVQDVVTRRTTEPWPPGDHRLALPGVKLDGGVLRAWYGESESPLLELRPIVVELPSRH